MDKVKVLEIVPNMQQGGLENLVMNIMREINKNEFEVHFLYHYDKTYFFDDEIRKLGGFIHKCSFREGKNIFKYILFLKNFFKKNKFDVVHSHMLSTSFFTLHYAKKNNVKILINHAHNTSTERSLKGFLKHFMIKISSHNANKLFACSKQAGIFAFKNREFTVINNCIDLERFKFKEKDRVEYRKKLGISSDDILIGTVGRMNQQKNQVFLLEAFSKSNNTKSKLLIIGTGELKQQILDRVKDLNLEKKVIILENIKNIENYYSAMDVFVLPSLFEGFPLTAIEAQANLLPCVFSNKIDTSVSLSNNNIFLDIDNKNDWINFFNNFSLQRAECINSLIYKYDIKYLKDIIENTYRGAEKYEN